MNEDIKPKKKKYIYFIGIDVSKDELDYAVIHNDKLLFHMETRNDPQDILMFINKLKELSKFRMASAIFCLENTGFYGNFLLQVLKKLKANISVEHPLHLKRSLGLVREKSDRSDAIQIAAYAQKNIQHLRLWEMKRPIIVLIAQLFTLRNRLLAISVKLTTPLKEQEFFIRKLSQAELNKLSQASIIAVRADLVHVKERIEQLIDGDDRLRRLHELILSVPGVGIVTATQILISTNEFLDISQPKKFAAYAGIAPFKRESGKKSRYARVSTDANRKMKTLLHISALAAIRHDAEMREYYERKTQGEGKPKLLVINAVRSKLILRVFACIKQDRPYQKNVAGTEKITAGDLAKIGSLQA